MAVLSRNCFTASQPDTTRQKYDFIIKIQRKLYSSKPKVTTIPNLQAQAQAQAQAQLLPKTHASLYFDIKHNIKA